MKKILSVLMLGAVLATVAACSSKEATTEELQTTTTTSEEMTAEPALSTEDSNVQDVASLGGSSSGRSR